MDERAARNWRCVYTTAKRRNLENRMELLRCPKTHSDEKRANCLQPAAGAVRQNKCSIPPQVPHVHIALQARLALVSLCRQ
jgi:hypothetical protein